LCCVLRATKPAAHLAATWLITFWDRTDSTCVAVELRCASVVVLVPEPHWAWQYASSYHVGH
jgi:hypothetical protein